MDGSRAILAMVNVAMCCPTAQLVYCPEGESHDRTWSFGVQTDSLGLPGSQQQLVEKVYEANPRTVVVLVNGGTLGVDWVKLHIPTVVEAFYPGELGGEAIVDILSGVIH